MGYSTDYTSGASLRWIELAETLRSTEVPLLEALALLRGVDPEIDATSAVMLSAHDVAGVLSACEAIVEFVDELRMLAESVSAEGIEVRAGELQLQAAAALTAGAADIRRVGVLARCLSVRAGFRALAEMLRCTDCHEAWTNTTIGHVLGCFRETDEHVVRRLTGDALLSPDARWDACDREQIARLAAVLEQHAAASCRR